jgi:hypothetical protein
MKLPFKLIAACVCATALASSSESPTSVTLPFEQYLSLKRSSEAPSLSAIEQVQLTGQFGKSLSVEFSGASPKKWDKRVIADWSDKFSFSQCKGQAHLDRENGRIFIVPTQDTFKLSCDLQVTNWASFELVLHNVLSLKTAVTGSQVVITNTEPGQKRVSFANERSTERGLAGEISSVGRYRITKLPDSQKFRYEFSLRNPGRGVTPFKIAFPNAEVVQQVTSQQPYTESTGALTFSLNPGNNEIAVEGKYVRNEFSALLANAQQYLLLESHPSFQLEIKTAVPRVSTSDTGLSPAFRNATAYQLSKAGKIGWLARELELIPSLGYSVGNANYVYYVPESGNAVVEASFAIENQGAPEIPLAITGTPTYIEIDGVAEPLYRSADGSLVLRLPTGQHEVLIQYQPKHSARGLATLFNTPLARPDAVLSNVQLTIGTPEKWRLMYGSSLLRSQSEVTLQRLLFALIAFGWMFGLCRWAKVRSSFSWGMALTAFGLTFMEPGLIDPLLIALVVALVTRYRQQILRTAMARQRALGITLLVMAIGVVAAVVLNFALQGSVGSRLRPMAANSVEEPMNPEMEAAPLGGEGSESGIEDDEDFETEDKKIPEAYKQAPRSTNPIYVGLPARITLPESSKQISFEQQLVDKDTAITARGYFISNTVFQFIALLLSLVGLYSLYCERRIIRAWLR